uniref:Si:ch73-335m24.2 n=1 Tax=Myripristis murdjan TaxID=586833 RepID=A0A667ZKH1_9TELE
RKHNGRGAITQCLYCCVLCVCMSYLHTILRNHTAHACEGDTLIIRCPSRTSVAVLSAFYGRRVPNQHLCPSIKVIKQNMLSYCLPLQKVLSECQDRRSCHIPVISPVFGQDPCPLTTKYLLVSYKCRPGNPLIFITMLVCENERLKLTCKNDTVLAIYSATGTNVNFCAQQGEELLCFCLSPSALRKVSRRCHGRANCSVLADTQTFGDPCFPGTRKHLRVSFTCGKWMVHWPHLQASKHGSLAGLPEKVALYFVSGICAGLVFLLCLFGLRSTFMRDVKDLVSDLGDELKASRRQRKDMMEDLYDGDISDTSSFRRLTQSYRTADIFSPSTMTVEMVEREAEQTTDVANGDIWPHRDSSPYAIHKIKAYNT